MEVHCPDCRDLHTVDVLFFSRIGSLVKCNACYKLFFIDRRSKEKEIRRNIIGTKKITDPRASYREDAGTAFPQSTRNKMAENDLMGSRDALKLPVASIRVRSKNGPAMNFLMVCIIFAFSMGAICFARGLLKNSNADYADVAADIQNKVENAQFENARYLALQYFSDNSELKSQWIGFINEKELQNQHAEKGKDYFKQGIIAFKKKKFEESITVFESALRDFNTSGDARLIALAHLNLAMGHRMLHDYETSLDHYRDALMTSKKKALTRYEGKALQGIGALYLQMGMHDEGLMNLESALLMHEEMGDRREEAMDRLFIGMIHRTSSPEKAEECIRRARTIAREIGDPIIYDKASHLLSRGFKL